MKKEKSEKEEGTAAEERFYLEEVNWESQNSFTLLR